MKAPEFIDVLRARKVIAPYLACTPLIHYPALGELTGARVFVKHENCQPIGVFKVRGGINLLSQLSPDERQRGVVARVLVPEDANPVKVASMRNLGAEVLFYGHDFDAAREHCEVLARESNM